MTQHILLNEDQRKSLCELMHTAFIELKYLNGKQAHDLAHAFQSLPLEIYEQGNFDSDAMRDRLHDYQTKHSQTIGINYVVLFNNLFPENPEP